MLPQAIYHLGSFDEDCVWAVANYFAARLAAQYTDRVLCSEGADELRPPFLDGRVITFCSKIPPAWKVYG